MFQNNGLENWERARHRWRLGSGNRPKPPAKVSSERFPEGSFDGGVTTMELPGGRMALTNMVEILTHHWEVDGAD